ncbi:MAG: hypothetical protein ACFFCS_09895 [Candidatus Hodarchaeota archaeon]
MTIEFNKENYANSITSTLWEGTPLGGGWNELNSNNPSVKKIFDLEMSLTDFPSWAKELALRRIGVFPNCGHYLFPRSAEQILEAMRDESSIDFFTSCYTCHPDRKAKLSPVVQILEAWLNHEDESSISEKFSASPVEEIDGKVVENIYTALGQFTDEKEVLVQRLVNQLNWWIKTLIWEGDPRESFDKKEYPVKKGYEQFNADYGNEGFSDPYFPEVHQKENIKLEKKIRKNKNIDSKKMIDYIHSTWLCAPKFFRYLEKIILKIGGSDIDILPDKLTKINAKEYARRYHEIRDELLKFIEEKGSSKLVGDHSPVKEWLARMLLLKLELYEEYSGFGKLIHYEERHK